MMKRLKRISVVIGAFIVLLAIGLCIVYTIYPDKIKWLLGTTISRGDVFVDRLKGRPYTTDGYDGIDVSKHNGVIKWNEVATNKNVKFVYIKATEGRNHTDCQYRQNIRNARKVGLKVGSYHFFTSKSSAKEQFAHFSRVAKKEMQDLVPVLDIEESGINGRWSDKQLLDSVRVFLRLAKAHYGKYPILYSNEHFYNKELNHAFDHLFLFIANCQCRPTLYGPGKHNIWQYTEKGHIKGIGEYVDLNKLDNGMTIEDLML